MLNRKKHHGSKLTLVMLSVLQSTCVIASNTNENAYHYVYPSRVTGQFLAGNQQQLGGFADAMVPLWQQPNQLFFIDGTILLGQSQRQTYSGGLGLRRLYEQGSLSGIWGIYSFLDYFHTSKKNEFVQLNPGIEWLATGYEARLQSYIPLSGRSKTYQYALASNVPMDVAEQATQKTLAFLWCSWPPGI